MSGSNKSVVYFVRITDFIKIGLSRNLKTRLSALANSSPIRPELVATVPGTRELEQSLHRELAAYRVNLEWFNDCAEVRSAMHRVVKARGGEFAVPEEAREPPLAEPPPASVWKYPWQRPEYDPKLFDDLTRTIQDVTDRFHALISSRPAQDARRVAEVEYQLALPDGSLMSRLYRCERPAESYAAAVKLLRRCSDKFGKVTDKAIRDGVVGDMSRAAALCQAATLLIERSEAAFSALRHDPGMLASFAEAA